MVRFRSGFPLVRGAPMPGIQIGRSPSPISQFRDHRSRSRARSASIPPSSPTGTESPTGTAIHGNRAVRTRSHPASLDHLLAIQKLPQLTSLFGTKYSTAAALAGTKPARIPTAKRTPARIRRVRPTVCTHTGWRRREPGCHRNPTERYSGRDTTARRTAPTGYSAPTASAFTLAS